MPGSDSNSALSDLVNRIATEVLNNDLLKKTSDALCGFVNSSFQVATDTLKAIENITKPSES